MNFLNKSRLFLLAMVVLIAACDKENFDEIVVGDPDYEPEFVEVNTLITKINANPEDELNLGCISIQFPFELVLESGMTVTVNSTSDFEDATDEEAPDPVVDFVFPLNVVDNEGNSTQVNDNIELGTLFASCIPDDGWDDTIDSNGTFTIPAFLFEELCFDLVYPVDLEDADENTYTANNEAELIDLIATSSNLSFVLPITVLDEEGNEVIIENVPRFYDLYYSCDGVSPPGTEGGILIDLSELDSANCEFETLAIQFPYDVVTEAGELITVEDENQEAALILSGENYTIQYPFNLVDEDGTVITINDEMEFILFILPCILTIEEPDTCASPAHIYLFFNQGQGPTACGYNINFPAQVQAEGVTYDLNSMNDYFTVYSMYSNQINAIDIIYPISVTLIEDGSTIEFEIDEEICTFVNGCG